MPLRRVILIFSSPARDRADGAAREILGRIVASVERLPDLAPDEAPLSVDELLRTGLTLRQSLRVANGMFGRETAAIINGDLPDDKLDAGHHGATRAAGLLEVPAVSGDPSAEQKS